MKHVIVTATALLLLASFTAHARPPHAVVEDGREVSAAMLSMPSSPDGVLSIQGCTACKRVSLTLGRTTQFFIGNLEVSYADFKRHLAGHPKSGVLVVSPINQQVVTRIRASAPDVQ